MNQDYLEIRYCSPKTGYITECINAQTPQGAINLIRARVPDASIASIKYHSAPAQYPVQTTGAVRLAAVRSSHSPKRGKY